MEHIARKDAFELLKKYSQKYPFHIHSFLQCLVTKSIHHLSEQCTNELNYLCPQYINNKD